MAQIVSFTDEDLGEERVKKADKMVLVFESPWCHGCEAVVQMVEGLSDEDAPGCVWGKVDISKSPKLAQRFGVMSLPTIIVLKKGEVAKRFTARVSREKLLETVC